MLRLNDPMHETFESLGGQYEENATAGCFFLISLEIFIKDRYECHDIINQCQNTPKSNKKLSDKFDWLQMRMNSLKAYKCVLEKNLLQQPPSLHCRRSE